MTYDQWKTRDPNDDYEHDTCPYDECDHDDYEVDILDSRCRCNMCSYSWYADSAQVNAEIERQRSYDEWTRGEERREFWRKLTLPIRWPIFRLLERIWPRKSLSVLSDEEIPF